MHQIKAFENRITVYFYFPTKISGVCCREVNLVWIFHPVPKLFVHYNNCPLCSAFSVRVWPWFYWFHEKVLLLQRLRIACPL